MHPMPRRLPPFVLESRHEAGSDDIDWMRQGNPDWALDRKRREERNVTIKEKLTSGRPVFYRSSGWSLWPFVSENNGCDIVLCEMQPHNVFCAHMVLEAHQGPSGRMLYCIGNARGHRKGHCFIEHIYGRLVDVVD